MLVSFNYSTIQQQLSEYISYNFNSEPFKTTIIANLYNLKLKLLQMSLTNRHGYKYIV